MLTKIISFFKPNKLIKIHIKKGDYSTILFAKQGQNLMDLTNKIVNSNANIYGLCDKQLACTTCSVHIKSHHQHLVKPKEQELDILYQLKHFRQQQTRMACQIIITPKMEGMVVEIPQKVF